MPVRGFVLNCLWTVTVSSVTGHQRCTDYCTLPIHYSILFMNLCSGVAGSNPDKVLQFLLVITQEGKLDHNYLPCLRFWRIVIFRYTVHTDKATLIFILTHPPAPAPSIREPVFRLVSLAPRKYLASWRLELLGRPIADLPGGLGV